MSNLTCIKIRPICSGSVVSRPAFWFRKIQAFFRETNRRRLSTCLQCHLLIQVKVTSARPATISARKLEFWVGDAYLYWRPAENRILADSEGEKNVESEFIDMEQIPRKYHLLQ